MGSAVPAIGPRRIIVAAIGMLGVAAGALPGIAGAATPETAPTSGPACEKVIPWPGARGGPAGVRAWSPGGPEDWMHNVGDGEEGDVSLTFGHFDEEGYFLPADVNDTAGIDLGGPFTDVPERVAEVRTQVWLMDLDGKPVVIMVKSLPHTPPELVAEAEAVVASIRVDRDCGGTGPRLLFDLREDWDTG